MFSSQTLYHAKFTTIFFHGKICSYSESYIAFKTHFTRSAHRITLAGVGI